MYIKNIELGLFSKEEIHNLACVEIFNSNLNYISDRKNSLYDKKLGPLTQDEKCETCKKNILLCTGHYGVINLKFPFLNPLHHNYLIKILNYICINCGNVLIKNLNYVYKTIPNNLKRFNFFFKKNNNIYNYLELSIDKGLNCTRCNFFNHKILLKKQTHKIYYNDNNININLEYDKIYNLLKSVNEIVYFKLGINCKLSHPKDCVLYNILVGPANIRPVSIINNKIIHSSLTISLQEIINLNNKIVYNDVKTMSELYLLMINLLNIYFFSKSKKIKKNILDLIMSKDGITKKYILGKRTNFSGRSVITGDIKIKINEIGIPINIAQNLTISEKINRYNINLLSDITYRKKKYNYKIYNKKK